MTTRPSNLSVYRYRSSMDGSSDLIERVPEMLERYCTEVRSFRPQWRGFESVPTTSMQYADLGAAGLMWTRAAISAQSNSNTLAIGNVPAEIRPATLRRSTCYLRDAGTLSLGGWQLDASGVLTFELMRATSTEGPSTLAPDPAAFTPSGLKGLSRRFAMLFPK